MFWHCPHLYGIGDFTKVGTDSISSIIDDNDVMANTMSNVQTDVNMANCIAFILQMVGILCSLSAIYSAVKFNKWFVVVNVVYMMIVMVLIVFPMWGFLIQTIALNGLWAYPHVCLIIQIHQGISTENGSICMSVSLFSFTKVSCWKQTISLRSSLAAVFWLFRQLALQ